MARLLLAWILALAFAVSPAVASAAGSACRGPMGMSMAAMGHGPTANRRVAQAAAKAPCDHGGMKGCARPCCDAIVAVACAAYRLPRIETRSLIAPLVGLSSPSRLAAGLDPPPKSIA